MSIVNTSNQYINKSDDYIPPSAGSICLWSRDHASWLLVESKAVRPELIKLNDDGTCSIDIPNPKAENLYNKISLTITGAEVADLLSDSNREGLVRNGR